MKKNYINNSSSKFKVLEELSAMSVDEVVEMIKENRSRSSIDYDARMAERMERLEEGSRVMKRATELSYQQTLVHFDI